MEPAQTIIRKLGGPNAVAEVVGVHRTRVSNWQRSRAAGGTDGLVPQKHHAALLAFARDKGIELKPEEFVQRPSEPAETH